MPLIHSKSKQALKENVRTLMHEVGESPHVKSRQQALAIAYETKRRGRAEGGDVFEGPIVSAVPGRTDRHDMNVASGSYVLPSETVSHLGENNTLAGLEKIKQMGPHGLRRMVRACGGAAQVVSKHHGRRAAGGGVQSDSVGKPIPVVTAGGEHVLPPDWVATIGDGDMELGHRLLDNFVLENRKKHINTLKALKPPARD